MYYYTCILIHQCLNLKSMKTSTGESPLENTREVVISVKPPYANLLVDGIKTIELRRKFPADIATGTRCYIYASAPIQRVIGEVKIAKVEKLPLRKLWKRAASHAMISWTDFCDYFAGLEVGYGINMDSYLRYDHAKTLAELDQPISRPPQSFCYLRANPTSLTL